MGNCLCILNNGDNTYFHEPSRTFHAIDLIICSPIIFPYFIFSVSNNLHSMIILNYFYHIMILITIIIKSFRTYMTEQTGPFLPSMQLSLLPAMTEGDINRAVNVVIKNIINAADLSIPKSSGWMGNPIQIFFFCFYLLYVFDCSCLVQYVLYGPCAIKLQPTNLNHQANPENIADHGGTMIVN